VKYKTSSGPGAILIADGEITHKRCRAPKAREWVVQNKKSILELFPAVRKNGVWIVTDIYTAKSRASAVLLDKESEIIVGVQAGVYGTDQGAPAVQLEQGQGNSGWIINVDVSLIHKTLQTSFCIHSRKGVIDEI
jgi:hypothetical protein